MKKILLTIILGMFLISFASSAQTEINIQTQDTGLIIEYPKIFNFEQNADFHLRFHVFNRTDGKLLTNTTTNCTLNIYSSNGEGLFKIENMSFGASHTTNDCQNCFNHHIFGGNFSEIGTISYIIRCETANIGGSVSVGVQVTGNGKALPSGIIILGFSIVLIFLLMTLIIYLIKAVGTIIEGSFDILDVAYSYGLYFGLLGINQLSILYLGTPEVMNWLNSFVVWLAFPMIVVPVLAFFLSLFRMKKEKKKEEQERLY